MGRKRLGVAIALGAALGACQSPPSVEVSVHGRGAEVLSLEVSASLRGVPALGMARVVQRTLDRFVLELPLSARGLLRVQVLGLDRTGCAVQAGEAALTLGAPAASQVALDLRPESGCALAIVVDGPGSVTYSSSALLTATTCNDRCALRGARGTVITLERAAANFSGWYDACQGREGRCQITLGGGIAQAVASFIDPVARGCAAFSWCQEEVRPSVPPYLRGLFGVDREHLFAVGDGVILHGDGRRWQVQADATDSNLRAVWGSAPADLWAVGQAGALLHYDGERWSATPSGTSQDLNALWGSQDADLWAAGQAGTLLRYDGDSWKVTSLCPQITCADLNGVWGSARSDVWLVGDAGTILRYDGARISPYPSGAQSALRAVYGSSSSDVWVVGDGATILRWQGHGFTPFPNEINRALLGVFSMPTAGTYAVGASSTLARLDGLRWDTVAVPGLRQNLSAIHGVGPLDLWALGELGVLLRYRP